jgi:cobalt-zinc-cadmium efflux system protein
LDGERHVLTAHIVVSKELECAERALLKQQISEQLAVFELAHTTIELEYPDEACRDH